MAGFVKVGEFSEIRPGECRMMEAQGRAIALFNVDGTIYALDNSCLHRGGPLGEGELAGEVVTCPWHGWQYNVRTGEKCNDSAKRVVRYEIKIEGGQIMVAL